MWEGSVTAPRESFEFGERVSIGDMHGMRRAINDGGTRSVRSIAILGTRGVPGRHGGFETFAEHLSEHLVSRGWAVTVYCQRNGGGGCTEDVWHGVRRVLIPVRSAGAFGSVVFDWRCIRRTVSERPDVVLTLGYNTAVLDLVVKARGLPHLINMDGLEWARRKWKWPARLWLRLNERAGCWFGDHLVADHPGIASHLARIAPEAKITMIPYGADEVHESPEADGPILRKLGLESRGYALVIARPEPENSILEIVSAFSRSKRNCKLVVLGRFDTAKNRYHATVLGAASNEVIFAGAVYDRTVVSCLRTNARLYVHGHQVGGTNPSLVEAMGAGSAVLAHDNEFNRWVVGSGAVYFRDADECDRALTALLDDDGRLASLRARSRDRHARCFTWPMVLNDYEALLTRWVAAR